jgi:hypothetical protein
MAKVLRDMASYTRLLDGNGNKINSTSNAINCAISADVTSSTAINFLSQVSNSGTFATQIDSIPVTGTQGNASTSQVTGSSDEVCTNNIDCQYVSKISAFGSIDQACTVTLKQSQDDITYYSTGVSYVGSEAEDFHLSLDNAGARYYQLVYSVNGTTVTATICGKN